MQTFNFNHYEYTKFKTWPFENLIESNGQPVKWEKALKCSCYNTQFSAPDHKCSICHGLGYTYHAPSGSIIYKEQAVVLDINRIRIRYIPEEVVKVYNLRTSQVFNIDHIDGRDIVLQETTIRNTQGIFVDYYKKISFQRDEVLKPCDNLDEIKVSSSPILSISFIVNADTNQPLEYDYFTDNFIKLSEQQSPGSNIRVVYIYSAPIKMLITEQIENMQFKGAGDIIEGNAQLTFMYYYDLGMRDKITVLTNNSSTRYTEMLKRGNDKLKVDQIIKIIEVRDNNRVYKEGVDFVFSGVHGIRWLNTGVGPNNGDIYTVMYLARKTYIVFQELWQDRHHGEIMLPRRLTAKRLDKINFYKDTPYPQGS
jgi:hypothetical protein